LHLLDLYSLSVGAKVSQPYVFEKFFPLTVDKYITFQPFSSKVPSKCYDLWSQVIAIIKPILDQNGISIVQVGGADEQNVVGTINLSGKTNWNQLCYIIRNSIMHFGCDSAGVHIADMYGKKIAAIYSNNFPSNVGPYRYSPDRCILLEPDRNGKKPS
jgi:ADP-heptose:LPS heptosyltransferase